MLFFTSSSYLVTTTFVVVLGFWFMVLGSTTK